MTPVNGVSVIIPCYNSARRLPDTLAHLAAQRMPNGLPWEVILIDNASTDDTAQTAQAVWPANAPARLRIVREAKPGLAHAIARGFTEARFDVITQVHDDNWAGEDWLGLVVAALSQHPEAGACGGINDVVYEVPPPDWFEYYLDHYACGPQGDVPGDVTFGRGWLYGAGLSVRRAAWQQLQADGFTAQVIGREGGKLISGEDIELCLALRQAGWRLYYDPAMRMQHFMPTGRLQWTYLQRLSYASGITRIMLDPYWFALDPCPPADWQRRYTWGFQMRSAIRSVAGQLRRYARPLLRPNDGDARILIVQREFGRLAGLLHKRSTYDHEVRAVRNAPWRHADRGAAKLLSV